MWMIIRENHFFLVLKHSNLTLGKSLITPHAKFSHSINSIERRIEKKKWKKLTKKTPNWMLWIIYSNANSVYDSPRSKSKQTFNKYSQNVHATCIQENMFVHSDNSLWWITKYVCVEYVPSTKMFDNWNYWCVSLSTIAIFRKQNGLTWHMVSRTDWCVGGQ